MTSIKLWLDDVRNPSRYHPNEDWLWVKTAAEAIEVLGSKDVSKVSLDHDLGEEPRFGNGYEVAVWIETQAFHGRLKPLDWEIHSQNPVGVIKMKEALDRADHYWNDSGSL